MENEIYFDNSFTNDVGFQVIKEWLSTNSQCVENKDYFLNLSPSNDKNLLNSEFQHTDEIIASIQRKDNLPHIKIQSMTKIIQLLDVKEYTLQAAEVIEIRRLFEYYFLLNKKIKGKHFELWAQLIKNYKEINLVINTINNVFDENGNIKDNASKNLKKINQSINNIHKNIEKKIQVEFKKYSNLGYLKDNKIIYKAEKATLPIISSYKNKVKGIVDSYSATGQTSFMQPFSLLELNNELNEFLISKEKEIRKILKELTSKIAIQKNLINNINNKIIYYDVHYTKSLLAINLNSITPKFCNQFNLKDAINPLFTLTKKKYIPLNFSSNHHKTIIISGPNSGGKTIVIKSIGLYSIMAQSGIHIPAKVAVVPIFNIFLSDIGDKQSLDDDLSTFSAHMKKISEITKTSNKNSLVLIDEMGTGTDPEIGASLSISVLNRLRTNKSFNLCTTHLTPIKIWADENLDAKNASMEFDDKNIKPTFIFRMGIPGSSYGIEIAQRMGLESDIILDATNNLSNKSFQLEKLLGSINNEKRELEEKLIYANSLKANLEDKELKLNQLEKELSENKKIISKNRESELMNEILGYRKKLENLVYEIKKNKADKSSIKKAQHFIEDSINSLVINEESKKNKKATKLKIGDNVYIDNLNDSGIIISLNSKNNKAVIEINGKKLSTNIDLLNLSKNVKTKKNKTSINYNHIETLNSYRIDLRGLRLNPAIEKLETFMDKSILSNIDYIEILHGKGTGALQTGIHKYLKTSNYKIKFSFAPLNQGGSGITIVEFSKK
tara:strand:+ start:232 stop:2577 length:2346 start_codon:yes stop_codon:yes gene_type:complete